jgi:hypothetical protein
MVYTWNFISFSLKQFEAGRGRKFSMRGVGGGGHGLIYV